MLKLTPDRLTLHPSGGTRYVAVTLPDDEPAHSGPVKTVLVVERSDELASEQRQLDRAVDRLVALTSPVAAVAFHTVTVKVAPSELRKVAFGAGSALAEAWLEGCLTVADERHPQPAHCILVTRGRPTVGPLDTQSLAEQAASIWSHTGIATSAVACGLDPHLELLDAIAWHGGGHCLDVDNLPRSPAPVPRRVLDLRVPAGVDVRALSRVRGQTQAEGVLSWVVGDATQVLFALTFQGQEEAYVEARLRTFEQRGEWTSLRFTLKAAEGRRNAHVMRLVDEELARVPALPAVVPDSRTAEGAAALVARFVPSQAAWPQHLTGSPAMRTSAARDLFRGCLLWGAVGCALGRNLVGLDPSSIRGRFGADGLRHYEGDAAGMVTGDVQIMREIAETMVDGHGRFQPESFARRLVRLLDNHRGIGRACIAAAQEMRDGRPWWKAGLDINSAGNGGALRVAPVGLAWSLHPNLVFLYRDAVLSALPTHTHPLGVAATVVQAAAVAWCVRERLCGRTSLDAHVLLGFLAELVEAIEDEGSADRRQRHKRVRLCDRIREVEGLVHGPPDEALLVTWNGAYALESIPAALYCFLHSPDDPLASVFTAVNGGFDADSVGAMTGQLSGVWCGAARLWKDAPALLTGLEWRESLEKLADRLLGVATAQTRD